MICRLKYSSNNDLPEQAASIKILTIMTNFALKFTVSLPVKCLPLLLLFRLSGSPQKLAATYRKLDKDTHHFSDDFLSDEPRQRYMPTAWR